MAERDPGRRSYGQYCGLARALDTIGDRWTLLVVRELLIRPCRFGELQAGLPGIATNLLTERLRQLEQDGLVERRLGTEPAEGTRYALTSRGEGLRAVIEALVRWSAPLMASGRGGDAFRAGWLAVALPALIRARPPRRTYIGLETCGEHLVVEASPEGATVTSGAGDPADARLAADPEAVLALASGFLDLAGARRMGAKVSGDRVALERVFDGRAGGERERARPGGASRRSQVGSRRRAREQRR
jgi:DNA-binding HxlR family transcriptional regulator